MKNPFKEEIYTFLGPTGAMIAGSKSRYRKTNPLNIVLFNANVCFVKENVERKFFGLIKKKTVTSEKIWWGDFDLTENLNALKNLAEATGETVVLLYEMDGRFENEENPLWENFVYKVTPEGKETLGKSIMSHVIWTEDTITRIPEEPQSIDAVEVISDILQTLQQEIAKTLKEKKPRASREPKPNTAVGEKPGYTQATKKPRKSKVEAKNDGSTEVVKKKRAPRNKKENNG